MTDDITLLCDEVYTREEAIEFLESAAPDAVEMHQRHTNAFGIRWTGVNHIEVFKHLLERGWAVTSMSDQETVTESKNLVWFEKVGTERNN